MAEITDVKKELKVQLKEVLSSKTREYNFFDKSYSFCSLFSEVK